MARSLAHIEKVHDVQPIINADRLELVYCLGWQCVVEKGTFKEGDLCVYFEIDSKVDYTKDPFKFMESKKGKVKTIRIRGVFSQGLAIPLNAFNINLSKYKEGDDVTELLGVNKIQTEEELRLSRKERDPQLDRVKSKYKKFAKSKFGKWCMKHTLTRKFLLNTLGKKKSKRKDWPYFVPKTDETRVENIPNQLKDKRLLEVTEKLDGISTTFFVEKRFGKKYKFGVCSRNVRQLNDKQTCYFEDNVYWTMAHKYDIEKNLNLIAKKLNYPKHIVLQGETIGSNIQANPYKLNENRFYGFNFIVEGKKWDSVGAAAYLERYGIMWVPILQTDFVCPDDMFEMKELATAMSVINNNVLREGCVYRDKENSVSFKNVSREYLLKHNS